MPQESPRVDVWAAPDSTVVIRVVYGDDGYCHVTQDQFRYLAEAAGLKPRDGAPLLVHGHAETKYVDGWFVASCECGYVYGGMTRDEADGRLLDHIDRAEGAR